MAKLQSIFLVFVLPLVLVWLCTWVWVTFDCVKLTPPKPFGYLNKVTTTTITAGKIRRPFDYFKLAQQWPPSICNRSAYPSGQCNQTFTIHGLWPDNFQGPWLENCTKEPFVNFTDLTLLQRLNENWPNILNDSYTLFWEKEWNKHGTCALFWYDQTTYFTLALDLKYRYNLTRHLQQSGIYAGTNLYPSQRIFNAIINLTTGVPDLMCRNQTLNEIRICFKTGSIKVINCPANRSSPSCYGNISLPPTPPLPNNIFLPF